ncbi:MAG TPA: glycosyltransferase family 39 protein [Candidatus Moranbacteria bacterium]|nr:glycosyltransferase family 39 protein [Candidatus Moranbacteria bacterium]HSA08283.1 glycosyltransferase family 39 protein [Candidatus Moranbacteria bacterium]
MQVDAFLKKYYKVIIILIMTFFTVVSVFNAKNDAATFDEVAHIPAAYSYVTQHDTRINPEHPPLIKFLSGIPLAFMNLNFDTTQKFWTGDLPNKWDEGQWAAGRHLLYEAGNDPDQIIFWSRLPIILISIILGLFLFKWGRELAGIGAGLLVLLLYAFDPNILGHNHFVTTDIGIAAFLTFSFYYFLKFIKNPTWKNVLLGGIFMGLVLVAKFSSILALPVYGLVLVVYALVKNNREENNWKTRLKNLGQYLLKGLVALVVATIVVWIVYEVSMFKMPKETFATTVDFFFSPTDTNIKTIYTNKILNTLNEHNITRPLAAYAFGPCWMFKRVSGGNGAYFLGQVGNGFTAYFPVVFLIKETLPFIFLALFALIYTLKETFFNLKFKNIFSRFAGFLRKSVVGYTLLIFIVLYAFTSITGGLNIGFRHLFPILPFAYLLIGKKVFDFLREKHPLTRRIFRLASSFLLLWIIFTPIAAYPNYTSYFNESVGGSENGYKYVTDSNTDWGQDLKRLKEFLDEHPQIEKIHVDYFGGGNVKYYLGDKYIPWYDSMRPVETGWYAISTNYLQGSIHSDKNTVKNNYAWTLEYEPVAMIGKSILIYYADKPPVNQ